MWTDAKDYPRRLQEAAEEFDESKARSICEELLKRMEKESAPFPAREARLCLTQLQRKRMFGLMQWLAEEFLRKGQNSPQIRRRLAQALLDQNHVGSAIPLLEELDRDTASCPDWADENAEAKGLLGRAYKQLYLDSKPVLGQAAKCYYGVYSGDPGKIWHGINVAALLSRARRDGIPLQGYPDPRVIAQEVLDTVEGRDLERNATMWELATAAEACVALDKPEDAIRWIQRYVECDDADAFELASTRRQFLEVWQLHDSSGIGAYILPPLNARLLQRSGGKVDVDARGFREARELSDARATLQRVLSDALYVSVAWWERGRARCQPVARIETELDADRGIGTGFLVRGGDLKDSLGDALFLLTNAHVISNDPRVADSLPLEKAYVSFKALGADGGRKRYRPMSLLWTSPPQELDATLLALETPLEGVEPCPLAGTLPLRDGSARIYVIGYPKGGGLSFSINDNLLLDYDTRLLHYRAPTEGGSSGSPVFNQNWEAIGIHHGGGLEMPRLNNNPGKYPANEGIWIQAIRKALEQ